MKSRQGTLPLLLIGLLLAAPMVSLAAPDLSQEPPARWEPPPEAFLACEGKAAGEAVVIETPYGDEIEAVCRYFDARLVAKPINGPPPRPRNEQQSADDN